MEAAMNFNPKAPQPPLLHDCRARPNELRARQSVQLLTARSSSAAAQWQLSGSSVAILAEWRAVSLYMLTPSFSSPGFSGSRLALPVLAFGALCVVGAAPVQAAPVANLTFDINAQISAVGATGAPTQTMKARVLLHGNRTRVEATFANQKSVTLIAPPYIYRLLPGPKAGVRWKMDGSRAKTFSGMGVDPQELIRNPGKIRAMLLQNGAKRVGATTLNGAAVEIYQISKPGEQLSQAKAWLRKSDALPLKLEAAGKGLQVTATWSNYARPKDLSAALFRAPQGYRIRDAKSAPPLAMF